MRATVVVPPAPIIIYEEAVARLRLETDPTEKADVEAMIAAATGHVDGPQGWLGRCLGPQTIDLDLDGFDDLADDLPYGPVIDVEQVRWIDGAGTAIEMQGGYELLRDRLLPLVGMGWPSGVYVGGDRAAVSIRYRAGYVVDPTAVDLVAAVPSPIRSGILMMVGAMYADRSATPALPPGAEALLGNYRVWR